jgi:hypothetical protein
MRNMVARQAQMRQNIAEAKAANAAALAASQAAIPSGVPKASIQYVPPGSQAALNMKTRANAAQAAANAENIEHVKVFVEAVDHFSTTYDAAEKDVKFFTSYEYSHFPYDEVLDPDYHWDEKISKIQLAEEKLNSLNTLVATLSELKAKCDSFALSAVEARNKYFYPNNEIPLRKSIGERGWTTLPVKNSKGELIFTLKPRETLDPIWNRLNKALDLYESMIDNIKFITLELGYATNNLNTYKKRFYESKAHIEAENKKYKESQQIRLQELIENRKRNAEKFESFAKHQKEVVNKVMSNFEKRRPNLYAKLPYVKSAGKRNLTRNRKHKHKNKKNRKYTRRN